MKILITGGTGFVGKQLTSRFVQEGYEAAILTRRIRLGHSRRSTRASPPVVKAWIYLPIPGHRKGPSKHHWLRTCLIKGLRTFNPAQKLNLVSFNWTLFIIVIAAAF